MMNLGFDDEIFDFCVSDQVLEHIEGDPFLAFAETVRVLKPGGFVCHTTCFLNEVHKAPGDFWRFTVDSLKLLAKHCGLTVTLAGGWGNREVISIMRDAQLRFKKIPNDPNNPIYQLATRNEPDWPISVWIIAQKPG
jgi:SAM-dependent methyltransferase